MGCAQAPAAHLAAWPGVLAKSGRPQHRYRRQGRTWDEAPTEIIDRIGVFPTSARRLRRRWGRASGSAVPAPLRSQRGAGSAHDLGHRIAGGSESGVCRSRNEVETVPDSRWPRCLCSVAKLTAKASSRVTQWRDRAGSCRPTPDVSQGRGITTTSEMWECAHNNRRRSATTASSLSPTRVSPTITRARSGLELRVPRGWVMMRTQSSAVST